MMVKCLVDFLGEVMVKDKGLNCKFIICVRFKGVFVIECVVLVVIFFVEEEIKWMYLKKWFKEELVDMDFCVLFDWEYYCECFGFVIQKFIIILVVL